LSTDDSASAFDPNEWVSQAEAARIKGVTRQAIHKLVQAGRVRTIQFGGRILVSRKDFDAIPSLPIRGPNQAHGLVERIKKQLDTLGPDETRLLLDHIKSRIGPHPIETEIGAPADLILETLWLSGELTKRMFRGMISEASFSLYVLPKLEGWEALPITGNVPFDFHLRDCQGEIRVQVKLQRSEKSLPTVRNGYFDVEMQKTRGGKNKGEETRPYRFGEFDVLAVSLRPSSGDWGSFLYTVARWLQPNRSVPDQLATHQPVPQTANDEWTNDFLQVVSWLRSGVEKTIRGSLAAAPRKG
jgi:hypothetical protein